ncbi:MAG: hypothetical protein HJJLKODD_01910 [Phycisphaerae bacterium]|nr:hypothetical protein [Phycisphaerae bacterium]
MDIDREKLFKNAQRALDEFRAAENFLLNGGDEEAWSGLVVKARFRKSEQDFLEWRDRIILILSDDRMSDFRPDSDQLDILFLLHRVRLTQVEIEAGVKLYRQKVAKSLSQLERFGYVHRPDGKRSGYELTAVGNAYIRELQVA